MWHGRGCYSLSHVLGKSVVHQFESVGLPSLAGVWVFDGLHSGCLASIWIEIEETKGISKASKNHRNPVKLLKLSKTSAERGLCLYHCLNLMSHRKARQTHVHFRNYLMSRRRDIVTRLLMFPCSKAFSDFSHPFDTLAGLSLMNVVLRCFTLIVSQFCNCSMDTQHPNTVPPLAYMFKPFKGLLPIVLVSESWICLGISRCCVQLHLIIELLDLTISRSSCWSIASIEAHHNLYQSLYWCRGNQVWFEHHEVNLWEIQASTS